MPARKEGRITDVELVRLRRQGHSLRALAEASGLSPDAVRAHLLRAMGASYHEPRPVVRMPAPRPGRIADAELVRRRRLGASLRALAEASGLSWNAVRRRLLAAMGPEEYALTDARRP